MIMHRIERIVLIVKKCRELNFALTSNVRRTGAELEAWP
jgi:hypothetical protein